MQSKTPRGGRTDPSATLLPLRVAPVPGADAPPTARILTLRRRQAPPAATEPDDDPGPQAA